MYTGGGICRCVFLYFDYDIVIFRYIFLEFSNAKDAAQAVKTANGYKLDKHHIFAVNHFEDFDK